MKKGIKKIVLVLSLLLSVIFTSGQYVARHMMTPSQYQSEFSNLSKKGYRITSLCGYTKNGLERYAAIWNKVSGPVWSARHGMTALQYQQAFTEMAKKGYRLRIISGYSVGKQTKFAAVWDKGTGGAWTARHNMTSAQYQQAVTDNNKNGYRLKYISGYVVNGTEYFAAIWEKISGGALIAKHNMTASQYQKLFDEYGNQGYMVKVVSGYQKDGTDLYAAIWEKSSTQPTVARHGMKGSAYQNIYDNMYYQGYVPVFVNAFAGVDADKYNTIWQNTNIRSIPNLRNFTLKESDNNIVILPNKTILETPMKNFSLTPHTRVEIECRVGFEADLEKVAQLTKAVLEKTFEKIDDDKIVEFYYTDFGENAINFKCRFWIDGTKNAHRLVARNKAIIAIKKAFDGEGIKIPVPVMALQLEKTVALEKNDIENENFKSDR